MLALLAQAAPAVPPTEWWVPIVSMLLIAVWDVLKRKFNLVEPFAPTPVVETPPVVTPPAPVTPAPAPARPVLDVVKELLPVLLPLLIPALTEALKPKADK